MPKHNPFLNRSAVHVENGGVAWAMIDDLLDEIANYRDGLCAGCGENMRLQGGIYCLECKEEREFEGWYHDYLDHRAEEVAA